MVHQPTSWPVSSDLQHTGNTTLPPPHWLTAFVRRRAVGFSADNPLYPSLDEIARVEQSMATCKEWMLAYIFSQLGQYSVQHVDSLPWLQVLRAQEQRSEPL